MGQAILTLEQLDADTCKNFEASVEALTHRRFEPEVKRLVYQENLWANQRKKRGRLGHHGREHKRARNKGPPPSK